jgi:hypothetical protein
MRFSWLLSRLIGLAIKPKIRLPPPASTAKRVADCNNRQKAATFGYKNLAQSLSGNLDPCCLSRVKYQQLTECLPFVINLKDAAGTRRHVLQFAHGIRHGNAALL